MDLIKKVSRIEQMYEEEISSSNLPDSVSLDTNDLLRHNTIKLKSR